jgi:hypothetical protein
MAADRGMTPEKPMEVGMSPRDGHPDWNELAALAEGRQPEAADLHRHLAGCRRCAAAYAEAVRLRTLELAAPERFAPSPDLVEAARAAGPAGVRPGLPGRRRRQLVTGTAVLAVAVLAILFRPGAAPPPPDVAAIQAVLVQQAPAGMVLPGLSPAADREPAIYRHGGTVDLHDELEALAAYRERRPGAESSFWLAAGYLAASRLPSATDLVREARRDHPDDLRLMILDAVASYRRSDLGRAETLLREVLVRDPDQRAARFNLALVLQETGRSRDAAQLLADHEWSGDPWLAGRVAAMRDTLR